MAHKEFIATVRRIAAGTWGRKFKSDDAAEKELLGEVNLTSAALLEIVRRTNVVINALVDDEKRESLLRDDEQDEGVPTNAKRFPDAKVGDILWHGSLDEGFFRHVVIWCKGDGHVRVCSESESLKPWITWACEWDYSTVEEAIAAAIKEEREYHDPRLTFALEAELAIANKGDLTRFMNGFYNEEDEDISDDDDDVEDD